MRGRRLAIDACIAGLVLGLSLAMLAGGGFGSAGTDVRELDWLGVALAMASALPLTARRSAPLAVYLVTTAASVALNVLGYPFDIPFGPVTAVYTVALTYGGARRRRRLTVLLTANLLVPATVVAYAVRGVALAEIAPELSFWAVVIVGVWIAGDRSRLRRAQVDALEHRAREAERERRLAVATEQTRIARELHDSAGHAINVILVQAGAARLLQDRDPERAHRAITTIEDVARDTITEIDRLVHALREDSGTVDGSGEPAMPADPAALEELLDRHRATGLAVGADLRGSRDPLPRSVAWAAYRILQEALTNATRHGRGSAQVIVSFQPRAVEITVTNPTGDNGSPNRNGHGIIGMRERVTLLGGSLEAGAEGGVFRVHAHLPHGESVR